MTRILPSADQLHFIATISNQGAWAMLSCALVKNKQANKQNQTLMRPQPCQLLILLGQGSAVLGHHTQTNSSPKAGPPLHTACHKFGACEISSYHLPPAAP